MKSPHRKLRGPLAALLCVACAALGTHAATARQRPAPRQSPQRAPSKGATKAAARKGDAKAKRERQQAVAALAEVADGARSVEDLELRAEILTRAADALWPADETAARSAFRRAWETATAADLADPEGREEDLPAKQADGPKPPAAEMTRARLSVLGVLTRRDARMAEALLAELRPTVEESAAAETETGGGVGGESPRPRRNRERTLSPAGAQRLGLALDILGRDDPSSAARIAAPLVAEGPARLFVEFLIGLRARAPREADALYLRLLSRTPSDPSADANDVLVLSSYVVSPHLFVTVRADASVQLNSSGRDSAEEAEGRSLPAEVRRAFFDVAAALLARPARPGADERESLDQASALFFAAGRLLPFFERDAPQHAPAVRERMEALAAGIEESRRERLAAHMPTETVRPKNPSDPLEKYVKGMSDPASRAGRFGMRLTAVAEAARRKLWDRARGLAADFADADARREASVIIASYQIKFLDESFADEKDENDFERAAAFAREADVPPAVRARGLAQAARMAARKGKRGRALELLEEGVGQALRADKGTGLRLDAIAELASLAAGLDRERAWELLPEVVRSANAFDAAAVEAAPPAGASEAAARPAADEGEALEKIFEPFRTDELFATMARGDVARALAEARALEDPGTRSGALVAAARAVLERAAKGQGVASR